MFFKFESGFRAKNLFKPRMASQSSRPPIHLYEPHSKEYLEAMMLLLKKIHGEDVKLQITQLKQGQILKGLDMNYDLPLSAPELYDVKSLSELPQEEQLRIQTIGDELPAKVANYTLKESVLCIKRSTPCNQDIYYLDNKITTMQVISKIRDELDLKSQEPRC